jgi:hypothetical protein
LPSLSRHQPHMRFLHPRAGSPDSPTPHASHRAGFSRSHSGVLAFGVEPSLMPGHRFRSVAYACFSSSVAGAEQLALWLPFSQPQEGQMSSVAFCQASSKPCFGLAWPSYVLAGKVCSSLGKSDDSIRMRGVSQRIDENKGPASPALLVRETPRSLRHVHTESDAIRRLVFIPSHAGFI